MQLGVTTSDVTIKNECNPDYKLVDGHVRLFFVKFE